MPMNRHTARKRRVKRTMQGVCGSTLQCDLLQRSQVFSTIILSLPQIPLGPCFTEQDSGSKCVLANLHQTIQGHLPRG